MRRFENQVAVITGANSGIGRSIALGLAQEGASLVLIARDKDRLNKVAEIAGGFSPQVRTLASDFNRDTDLSSLASRLNKDLPEVHLLIHSAGTIYFGGIKSEPVDNLDELYRVLLRAPYLLTQALLPALRACQGQIVFINSSAGAAKPHASNGLYATIKHGLRALTDSLRDEVNQDGIRVVSLFPGRTATPMQAHVHDIESRPYKPELLIQPEDVFEILAQTLTIPRTVEITDIHFRPLVKSY